MMTQHSETLTGPALDDLAASFGASEEIPQIDGHDPGRAGDLASGLAQQSDLAHQVAIDENCGRYWSGHFNAQGQWTAQPIRCGQCDECLQRKAALVEKRILMRIETRQGDNDSLVVSQLFNVPTADVMALQKRIQRDETAHYYRAINEAGAFDFIIQSETIYGDAVDVIDYDFALAAKVAKAKGKRQTGLLYSQKSKKIATEGEETYSLNLTKITAKRASDSKRITTIAKAIKPDEYAFSPEEHQARIFALTTRLTGALDEAGIPYRTEGIIRQASVVDRLKYNANVIECPNKSPIETEVSIGALSGQKSLFDQPEPETEPAFYPLETTQQEDIERQITLCWMN